MEQKVCGIDVHRDTLVATILLDQTGQKQTRTFTNNTTEMQELKDWLKTNNCQDITMESTGSYWTTLYTILEDAGLKPVLANAHQVKAIPGRKTDQKDSEWLAHLHKSGLIRPSYVPEKQIRELREPDTHKSTIRREQNTVQESMPKNSC
ncbi:MAG: transposase [Nitrososphaerota archaeon]|jgi:transposase|nr:transposase [Nitrososphaerota archaeon]